MAHGLAGSASPLNAGAPPFLFEIPTWGDRTADAAADFLLVLLSSLGEPPSTGSGPTTRSLTGHPAQVGHRMTRRLAVRDWRAKSVQDRRAYPRLTLGSHRDRRPGHSPDRTLR